jgi:GNAT superfamily N-acetyltransferase
MSTIAIRGARAEDEPAWRELWRGYCEFYETEIAEPVTAATWARLLDPDSTMVGVVAVEGERVVGFANYVVHPSTWSESAYCYLEDLFVQPEARGNGAGRALIEALRAKARTEGWDNVYWHTREGNTAARALYDTFTERDDFVRYVLPVE